MDVPYYGLLLASPCLLDSLEYLWYGIFKNGMKEMNIMASDKIGISMWKGSTITLLLIW